MSERFIVMFSYMKLVAFIVISTSLSVSLSGCSTAVRQEAKELSVYDRVIKTGKLRCGYVVYTPGCIKDPNTGKLSGIGVEAIELVAQKLGLKVEWTEEVGWGTMIEGLQTGRYDLIATPIWTNANRAKVVDFAKPLFFSPVYAYVSPRNSVQSTESLSWLNSPSHTIATIDGETGEIIAQEDFPQAKTSSLPQLSDVSQLLLNVSTGKAEVAFVEPAVAVEFLKHNKGAVKVFSEDQPVRVFSNCWMFRRNQTEFKAMIDTVLDQLHNSGAINRIVAKFESSPGVFYRVALPYQKP